MPQRRAFPRGRRPNEHVPGQGVERGFPTSSFRQFGVFEGGNPLFELQPHRLDLAHHLRDHVLVHLELADLFAELLAVVAVFDRGIQAGLGQPHRTRRRRKPGLVERAEDDLGPVARRPQKVFLGQAAVRQKDFAGRRGVRAHLVQLRGLDTVEVLRFQHEGRKPPGFLGAVRVGIVDEDIGHVGVGDPGLDAVQAPAAIDPLRRSLAARALGWDVRVILYDVTRKPSIRQKQGETAEEFGDRLAKDTKERPEFYFARREVTVLDDDIQQFVEQRLNLGKMILYFRASAKRQKNAEWAWPRNCNGMTCRSCEYSGFCLSNVTVDVNQPPAGFNAGIYNPELTTKE